MRTNLFKYLLTKNVVNGSLRKAGAPVDYLCCKKLMHYLDYNQFQDCGLSNGRQQFFQGRWATGIHAKWESFVMLSTVLCVWSTWGHKSILWLVQLLSWINDSPTTDPLLQTVSLWLDQSWPSSSSCLRHFLPAKVERRLWSWPSYLSLQPKEWCLQLFDAPLGSGVLLPVGLCLPLTFCCQFLPWKAVLPFCVTSSWKLSLITTANT